MMTLKLLLNIQMLCKMFTEILKKYNLGTKVKILIAFDHLIAAFDYKKLFPVVTGLFIRGRKLNITIVLITQSYFKVPEEVRLNSKHFFIMEITSKRELKQIALNHLSNINLKHFMKIYKKCTAEHYCFLITDTTYHQIIL